MVLLGITAWADHNFVQVLASHVAVGLNEMV